MPTSTTRLGELLKRSREALGYSRTRAAQLSDVNASSIEAWEVGRVSKPPIHDVMRLARVLGIPTEVLERAVLEESAAEHAPARAGGVAEESGAIAVGVTLLERAATVLNWSDADAARALDTEAGRIVSLRAGTGDLSVLEVLTLIAVLARFPAERGGASRHEVDALLAQLNAGRVSAPLG